MVKPLGSQTRVWTRDLESAYLDEVSRLSLLMFQLNVPAQEGSFAAVSGVMDSVSACVDEVVVWPESRVILLRL